MFTERMQRRYERDRQRIHRYFGELRQELHVRRDQGRVAAGAAGDKEAALERERQAKQADHN